MSNSRRHADAKWDESDFLSTRVCIHGRLESDAFKKPVPCATCEYEAPRFLAARDNERPGVA